MSSVHWQVIRVAFLLTLLVLVSQAVFASPFLIGDVTDPDADVCVFAKGAIDDKGVFVPSGPSTEFPVVTDVKFGNPKFDSRICKVDLKGTLIGKSDFTLGVKSSKDTKKPSDAVPYSVCTAVAEVPRRIFYAQCPLLIIHPQ